MTKNTILSLKNITKSYDDLILDKISFDLKTGQSVALVGASGSGKSTLLHIAGLLDNFDSGELIIDGMNCNNISESKKTKIRHEKIGFVYQMHNLLPEFCVWENVAYPMWVGGVGKKQSKTRALQLLDDVGLADKANQKSTTLSGGEAQRVAIARALANNPSIILADEPTGNLDDTNTKKIWDLLLSLIKSKGISMMCVTHDMALAKKTNIIYQLNNKKITKIK